MLLLLRAPPTTALLAASLHGHQQHQLNPHHIHHQHLQPQQQQQHGWIQQHTSSSSDTRRLVAASAAKKQKPKRRTRKGGKQPVSQRIAFEDGVWDGDEDEEEEEEGLIDGRGAQLVLVPPPAVPKAPPPVSSRGAPSVRPEDLYAVFPQQPRDSSVSRLPGSGSSSSSGGKWSWGDDGSPQQQQQEAGEARPLWNPKTGFMRSRADVAKQAAAAAAAAGGGAGSSAAANAESSGSSSRLVEPLPPPPPRAAAAVGAPSLPPSSSSSSSSSAAAAAAAAAGLPAVSREQVLGSCAATSAAMVAASLGLRLLASQQSAALFGTSQADIDRLLQLPAGLQDAQQAGLLLGAAAAVTGARLALLRAWPAFAESTKRSNQQVLGALDGSLADAALIALLSGVSEELLFRGALVPATWPDARGVLAAGALFGVLHVSGGRSAAYAPWAAAVGWLYGGAFLASGGNVWVPAGAHALANFASAALWMAQQQPQQQGEQQQQLEKEQQQQQQADSEK